VNALLAYLLASADNQAAALVRDTAAVTSLAAGVADNMLPQTCNVSINFRLLPGTPRNATIQHVLRWLGPDAHANISLVDAASAPSRVTDHKGLAFRLAQAAIQRTWRFADGSGELLPVLPFLMPGGTDSKWYQNLTTR
jgi:acetylornithine deacetylase/succinyl-diaminopimelate desuccinylase-like protein